MQAKETKLQNIIEGTKQRVGRISDSVIRRMMFIHIWHNTAIAYCALGVAGFSQPNK
jgi:hypothetical protein